MDTLPDTPRPAASDGPADDALLRAVAGMRPGWTVLRECALTDGHQGGWARVRYALLHPEVGIALLDVLPGATSPRAPERLRRLLDAAAFQPPFGDYPPIIYLRVPWRSLSGLDALLAREFDLLPPLALARGGAWVGAAQRVLTAEPPLRVPGHAAAGRPPIPSRLLEQERGEGRPAPQATNLGLRGLAMFWSVVALAFGGVALALQVLGPTEGSPAVAHAGGASPGETQVPQATSEAWLTPSDPDKARLPSPGPTVALWSVERMPTPFDAARAGAATPDTSDDLSELDPRPGEDHSAPAEPAVPAPPKKAPVSSADFMEARSVFIAEILNGADLTEAHAAFVARISAGVEAADSSAGAADNPVDRAPAGGTAPSAGDAGNRDAPAPALEALFPVPRAFLPGASAQAEGSGGLGKAPAASAGRNTLGATAGATDTEAPQRLVGGTRDQSGPAAVTDAPDAGLLNPAAASGTGAAEPASSGRNSPNEMPVSTPSALAEALITRGDAMVARRDISAARLLYERAAVADARAAAALARAYDPAFLAEIGVQGIRGDTALATAWYRKAISLGDSGALARVEALNGPDRPSQGKRP